MFHLKSPLSEDLMHMSASFNLLIYEKEKD